MYTDEYRVVMRFARQVLPGDLLIVAGLRRRVVEVEQMRGGVRLHLSSGEVFQANHRSELEVHQRKQQVPRVS